MKRHCFNNDKKIPCEQYLSVYKIKTSIQLTVKINRLKYPKSSMN